MQLYLIRHPRLQIETGICYGQSDVAPDPGHLDELISSLPQQLPLAFVCYASPSQRCRLLASAIHEQACFDARLMEINLGAWELRAWDEIARSEIDAWALAPLSYCPGDGESAFQLAQRVIEFLVDIEASVSPEKPIVIISHAGVMRCILAYEKGLSAQALAQRVLEAPCNILYGEVYTKSRIN